MIDCNKVIKDIEYAKDLLQNRPEQDTVDYKVYEVLDDALDLIHDLQSQIAMLVVAQHELCELLKEQEAIMIKSVMINGSGRNGRCQNCLMMLNELDYPNFCGNCGQAVKWE